MAGGIAAGFINTLAGGGSFLTVPLLIFLGLPATVANATNRVGVFVQSATAVAGFRQEGISESALGVRLLPATLAGSWIGAWAAASIPDAVFARVFGVAMLAMLPVLLWNPRPRADGARRRIPRIAEVGLYGALGFYGGAVQAGIGIPLVLALVTLSGLDLVRAASARVFLTLALTAVALGQFLWAGKVDWLYGIVLALGTGSGGYLAARLGARVGPRLIRPLLAAAVIVASLRLLAYG
ncbi:MAG: sulfite exporter TauE/SafE family protein [Myxococcota bacterium]